MPEETSQPVPAPDKPENTKQDKSADAVSIKHKQKKHKKVNPSKQAFWKYRDAVAAKKHRSKNQGRGTSAVPPRATSKRLSISPDSSVGAIDEALQQVGSSSGAQPVPVKQEPLENGEANMKPVSYKKVVIGDLIDMTAEDSDFNSSHSGSQRAPHLKQYNPLPDEIRTRNIFWKGDIGHNNGPIGTNSDVGPTTESERQDGNTASSTTVPALPMIAQGMPTRLPLILKATAERQEEESGPTTGMETNKNGNKKEKAPYRGPYLSVISVETITKFLDDETYGTRRPLTSSKIKQIKSWWPVKDMSIEHGDLDENAKWLLAHAVLKWWQDLRDDLTSEPTEKSKYHESLRPSDMIIREIRAVRCQKEAELCKAEMALADPAKTPSVKSEFALSPSKAKSKSTGSSG